MDPIISIFCVLGLSVFPILYKDFFRCFDVLQFPILYEDVMGLDRGNASALVNNGKKPLETLALRKFSFRALKKFHCLSPRK
jgi:hypothetical protein